MATPRLSEDQAVFIAGLPNVFCDVDYAIRVHAHLNRTAKVSVEFACEAVQLGVTLGYIDRDRHGRFRLTPALQKVRDDLDIDDGPWEYAVWELSNLLVQQTNIPSK